MNDFQLQETPGFPFKTTDQKWNELLHVLLEFTEVKFCKNGSGLIDTSQFFSYPPLPPRTLFVHF